MTKTRAAAAAGLMNPTKDFRRGQSAHKANTGRTETMEGLIMAPAAHNAPYPVHAINRSVPLILRVAAIKIAIHKAARLVSQTHIKGKYIAVGKNTHAQAVAIPVFFP